MSKNTAVVIKSGMLIIGFILLIPRLIPPLLENIGKLDALHQVYQCINSDPEKVFGLIWIGGGDLQNNICSPVAFSDNGDISAIFAWYNKQQVSTDQLLNISPGWRKQLYSWRNEAWRPMAIPPVPDGGVKPAVFLARLAGWAWAHQHTTRAITLAESALVSQPDTEVSNLLVRMLSPRSAAELPLFLELRRKIAEVLPENIFNYSDWFGVMVSTGDYSGASEPCQLMQQNGWPEINNVAATCLAQLAFYRGDALRAYDILQTAIHSFPKDVLVLTWYGLSAKQLGNFEQAEQLFQQAILVNRDHNSFLNLYWNLGECQYFQGKNQQAIQSYHAALRYATQPADIQRLRALMEQAK